MAHVFVDRMRFGNGEDQAPVAQENAHEKDSGPGGGRQHIVEKRVPEKELQQGPGCPGILRYNGRHF
jgi:hypothetical protein